MPPLPADMQAVLHKLLLRGQLLRPASPRPGISRSSQRSLRWTTAQTEYWCPGRFSFVIGATQVGYPTIDLPLILKGGQAPDILLKRIFLRMGRPQNRLAAFDYKLNAIAGLQSETISNLERHSDLAFT